MDTHEVLARFESERQRVSHAGGGWRHDDALKR